MEETNEDPRPRIGECIAELEVVLDVLKSLEMEPELKKFSFRITQSNTRRVTSLRPEKLNDGDDGVVDSQGFSINFHWE